MEVAWQQAMGKTAAQKSMRFAPLSEPHKHISRERTHNSKTFTQSIIIRPFYCIELTADYANYFFAIILNALPFD